MVWGEISIYRIRLSKGLDPPPIQWIEGLSRTEKERPPLAREKSTVITFGRPFCSIPVEGTIS